MVTQKRGPVKIDLIGPDGKKKLDVERNTVVQKYVVSVRGGKTYHWTATQFAAYFRKWLLWQRGD